MDGDAPPEGLGDLEAKREWANGEAEKHRRRRDELNMGTRSWVGKRDALNAQVRALVEQATQHRQKRDELNARVQTVKAERDVWNRKVNELLARVNELKRAKAPRTGPSVGRLKREASALEFRQQTSVLTAEEERELIEEMGRIQTDIRKQEKELEQDAEVRAVLDGLGTAKETAESWHRQVGELAEEAQKEHDTMVALFEQSDALRGEADVAQEEFIKTKMLADEEHRKHIEFVRQVHDYDKIVHGIRQRSRGEQAVVGEAGRKRQAEVIFERFKKGEKLSTEDLMMLQKSGYM